MWSDGIREFVDAHQLNPDNDQWNFRHIFGTNTKLDHHYNTPRVWFAQRYLSPVAAADQTPESPDMPFIRKPERKIAVEDIQYLLKSHFNETKYDPLGDGSEHDKKVYRPIALSGQPSLTSCRCATTSSRNRRPSNGSNSVCRPSAPTRRSSPTPTTPTSPTGSSRPR